MSGINIAGHSVLKSNAPKKSEGDQKQSLQTIGDGYILVPTDSKNSGSEVADKKLSAGTMGGFKNLLSQHRFGDYKGKSFKVKLYEAFYFNSNGSGVVASGIPCEPSTITEFSSAAQLFDEFRVVSGHYTFRVAGGAVNSGTNLLTLGAIAYDPTDGTSPASVVAVCQLDNHKLFGKPSLSGGATLINPADKTHTISFRVPAGSLTSVATPVTVGTSNWQPTAGTPQPYGWMKVYTDNMGATSTALSGIMCYDVEFRLRA